MADVLTISHDEAKEAASRLINYIEQQRQNDEFTKTARRELDAIKERLSELERRNVGSIPFR